MSRYMPITGIENNFHALLIDAAYRIAAVTQLLENLAMRSDISTDAVVLQDFAQVLAIPLRDGCDLLDVIGRRLQAQVLAS
ncbi:hypothetical protein SAMN03159488_00336 [Pseudomonas sp. NFIX10]|uniref:hypothetical protein n=1 Tax=unclassified Pseudomonas TaxID=196821 RepID=UPI0008ED0154|nr:MULTISPECIES: hypothetical protein [unclassified Pseudomonas]SFA74995.1 hypothetical protein SAMN03159488_00336 [Pseudomonas sp. NFIX10]SFE00949.1 hypothetical protein SAMN03159367_00026 [Pseudomonas sp. NFACC06-1]